MAKAAKKSSKSVPANAMDYPEHEKTYDLFLWLTRWTIAACVALLIAMMIGFFAGGGLFGGILAFVALIIVAFFLV